MSRIISGLFPIQQRTIANASVSASEASEPLTSDIGKWISDFFVIKRQNVQVIVDLYILEDKYSLADRR